MRKVGECQVRVFTMAEFRTIMSEAAGEVAPGDVADTTYRSLGYDSLAVLEISARIKQSLGVTVADEAVTITATPAETLAAINHLLSARVPA
jgi:minimal PKS acyl carrier protein